MAKKVEGLEKGRVSKRPIDGPDTSSRSGMFLCGDKIKHNSLHSGVEYKIKYHMNPNLYTTL